MTTTNTKGYVISWTNGREDTAETYEAAKELVLAEYPDAEIGHDGDLDGFGDRTLCWATEEDSVDDDGARAICSIRVAENDVGDSEDDDSTCPRCGHPKDGSSGHGTCNHPCHEAA